MSQELHILIFGIILKVIGGLGIFLLGMKNMSEGMQSVAGNRLRKMISAVTNNRLTACGVGVLVTSIVQSSSVTTVMVVGFVSAGFMTLAQAIGVIMGANIGTTVTAWILVLEIGKFGLPILGMSAFFFLFVKNEKLRYSAMAIMGVGMIFFGLELMSAGLKPIRSMPEFLTWFSKFSADDYWGMWKCILAGCVLTCVVQSSSATIGITMGLAMNGIIGFHTAAALVLGENIGTTVTAFLASLGGTTDAKRAAYAHIIFNILGVLWISTIFQWYLKFITGIMNVDPGLMVLENGVETFPHIRQGIAFVHSGFNIANTLIFLPMLPLFVKVVTRIVPARVREEPHLTFLDIRMLDTPAIGIQESRNEIIKMAEMTHKMFIDLRDVLTSPVIDEKKELEIFRTEQALDGIQKEITEFIGNILSGNIPADIVLEARIQFRLADEYESVSDYIANILKLCLKQEKNNIRFTEEGCREILALHDKVYDYMELVNEGVKNNDPAVVEIARLHGDSITHEMKESRARHITRVESGSAGPLASLIFTDMLNAYRRIKDHGLNIAEAIAGEK